MRHLLLFISLAFITIEKSEVVQLDKDLKFELKNFTIREAFILSNSERFVIASETIAPNRDIGLRLIYTDKNELKFKSQDVGESYIYRPTFFRFPDSTFLIICERGFEYSAGVDVYEFRKGMVKRLGELDLGFEENGQSASIAPRMTIERVGNEYRFGFTGPVIINPGGKDEAKVDGGKLSANYFPGAW